MGNQVSLFAFRKTLEKQTKTIEGQGKKKQSKAELKNKYIYIYIYIYPERRQQTFNHFRLI